MKIVPLYEVKARFSEYLERCRSGPVVVTKNGRAAAILVHAPENEEDLDRFLLANNPRFRRILEKGKTQIRAGKGIPHREFWKRVRAKSR